MKILPKARTAELVEQDLGQELLIYDLTTNKACTLNETSKIVFNACGGTATFDELKRRYKFTDDLIYLALDELQKNNLLEGYASKHVAGLTRREVVKRVGLSTMIALPIITGIFAPSAANAASSRTCAASDQGCVYNSSMQSNCCSATQRCYGDSETCRDCLSPGSAFAVALDPTVAYCNAQVEKNICCVNRGNASLRPAFIYNECVCPIPL